MLEKLQDSLASIEEKMTASFSEIKHRLDSLEEQFRANPPALVSTLLLQEKQISNKGTRITTLFLRTLAGYVALLLHSTLVTEEALSWG